MSDIVQSTENKQCKTKNKYFKNGDATVSSNDTTPQNVNNKPLIQDVNIEAMSSIVNNETLTQRVNNKPFMQDVNNEIIQTHASNVAEIKEYLRGVQRENVEEKHKLTEDLKIVKTEIKTLDVKFRYILDPLSVIIKLAILSYKEPKTKISIYNNTLYIQEFGVFQSIVRYYFKDTKNDLHYLYNPIELACAYFLTKPFINNNNCEIKNLFQTAQKGLENLILIYKETQIIVHTLFMYYNLISNYLGENYNKSLFMKDEITALYNDTIVKSLNSKWTNDKIKMLLNMFEFVDKDENNKSSVKCLDEFMVHIDNDTRSYLIFVMS